MNSRQRAAKGRQEFLDEFVAGMSDDEHGAYIAGKAKLIDLEEAALRPIRTYIADELEAKAIEVLRQEKLEAERKSQPRQSQGGRKFVR